MFCEVMRDGLVFMDKVEQGMPPDEEQAHWDAYADYKAQGFKIVLFSTEADAEQAAEDYRKRGLVSGRSKRGSGKKKSGGGDNRVSTFMVATKLLPENFEGWDTAELATLDDPAAALATMYKRICAASADVEVESCYGIAHDSDSETFRDAVTNEDFTLPTDLHVHLTAKFSAKGKEKGLTVAAIAKAIGLSENMVERGKSGRYSADNFMAYLIHAKDSQKYQYSPRKVITLAGDDYMDVWSARISAWEHGASTKTRKRAAEDVDWLIDQARMGKVSRDDIFSDKALYNIYSIPGNKTKVDVALQAWGERRMFMAAEAMRNGEFSTTVLFLYGKPGTGKSTFAKAVLAYLRKAYGWDVASLAASHAMDEYRGQSIILLDDARSGAMSAEDWLKLLDPNTPNPASARYSNKADVAPKVVIVVSNKSPLEFFYYARNVGGGDRSEAVDTFFRRLQWYVTVFDPFETGLYNCEVQRARYVGEYQRPIVTDKGIDVLTGLRYDFRSVTPDVLFSPYGAIDIVVRDIDRRSAKGALAERVDGEAVFAEAAQCVYAAMAPAMASRGLPALPAPSDAVPAERNLRDVYEQVFTPLWREVHAKNIARDPSYVDRMATFEEWRAYGCHDAYDEVRGFHRAGALASACPDEGRDA